MRDYDPNHRPERTGAAAADALLPVFSPTEECVKCSATDWRPEYVAESDMIRARCGCCSFWIGRRPVDDQPCDARLMNSATNPFDFPQLCGLRLGHEIPHDWEAKGVTDDAKA